MSQQAQGMQGVRRGSFGEQHWAFAEHLVPSLLFPWMFSTWGQVYVLWVWARITSYHHFGVVGAQVLQHFTNKIVVAGWWNDHPASWSGRASMPCPTKLSDMQRCWSVCLHWSFSLCMTWPEGCGSLLGVSTCCLHSQSIFCWVVLPNIPVTFLPKTVKPLLFVCHASVNLHCVWNSSNKSEWWARQETGKEVEERNF